MRALARIKPKGAFHLLATSAFSEPNVEGRVVVAEQVSTGVRKRAYAVKVAVDAQNSSPVHAPRTVQSVRLASFRLGAFW